MTNEYGACLLDELSSKKLQNHIPFLDKENHPHISFFQFKCKDERFLISLKKYISRLFLPIKIVTDKISFVENNIFLDLKDDSSLRGQLLIK